MQQGIQLWLRNNGYGEVTRMETLSGGCINRSSRLHFDQAAPLVLKQNDQAVAGMFRAEAVGLQALASAQALRVPAVIHCANDFILLEDLGQGHAQAPYWQDLGTGLATLHRDRKPQFGFSIDNYCGTTPQLNSATQDGFAFFANCRLLNLATQALQRRLLEGADLNCLENIASRLSNWIPQQPPVLIHGDLWSGNVHCDAQGNPALIDPACYWGWAEAELAMTSLFGGFEPDFYASYAECSGMDSDWPERAPLYNLYHLLNHLLLFGGSYLGSIRQICRRFAS